MGYEVLHLYVTPREQEGGERWGQKKKLGVKVGQEGDGGREQKW